MTTHEHDMTLVIGATGRTGRRVAERLRERGVRVRPGSRSGEPPLDSEDRSTWALAPQGASVAYVSFFPDLAVPGAPEAIATFAELAAGSESYLLDPVLSGDIARPAGPPGPRLLSFGQAVEEIAPATGRPIRCTSISPQKHAEAMTADDLPDDIVSLATYLFTAVLDGQLADGVPPALGRPPRDFADYAREAATSGVWSGR